MINEDVYRKEIGHGPLVHSVIHYAIPAPEGTPPGEIRLWLRQVHPVRTPDGGRIPTPPLHYPELVDGPASPDAGQMDSLDSADAGPMDNQDSAEIEPKPAMSEMDIPASPSASADFEYLAGQPSPDGSVSLPRATEESNINKVRPSLMRSAKLCSCRCKNIGARGITLAKDISASFVQKYITESVKQPGTVCRVQRLGVSYLPASAKVYTQDY